jgi:hypothetical protein
MELKLEDGDYVEKLTAEQYTELFLLEHDNENFAIKQGIYAKIGEKFLCWSAVSNSLCWRKRKRLLSYEEFLLRAKNTIIKDVNNEDKSFFDLLSEQINNNFLKKV